MVYSLLPQNEEKILVDVAGPLCFQGDYQARDVELPPAVDGDILAVHDTGAYTMSMYCKYESIINH